MTRKTHWRLHTAKDKNCRECIKDQTMPNKHVRKFISKFESVVDYCLKDCDNDDRKALWKSCIQKYALVINKVRQREDFTNANIEAFEHLTDEFYRDWLVLHRRDGVTNYFHMIGCGHLTYYLREWRNLYRYSQQGWESLNHQIKIYYFTQTQRGGHQSGVQGEVSKIKPIGLWLQRRLLWISGDADDNK